MAKQLNQVGVNLTFSADTSQARAQLQQLQMQLQNITKTPPSQLSLKKDISEAVSAAAELSVHLKNATNMKTGNLDFSKLNQSIKKSGMTLQQYGRQLQSLGPQGQQAFMSLAHSVANAEVPIRRSNALLREMGTTLMNTARWQLSSSILHGFMGAVSSAYGYAKDLNQSLNNIRIVTGQNTEQMAKFAKEANKAAKALSATTTEYTNASLIYYQQGLNDQQVKERTDVTIKMANVARQSAEVVSDQMTAVWNNFADGSKSLEYYADVMTALGAATASSTEEIATGLEKFAAVAETVGLSYEYATAALATVTSQTRQSAEVVGTAFKTLFARIQDLELGKTLEDGTTLGSYSQALMKVGVNIKDANGQLKDMDTILNEMASKWDTLSKDQQVALAQNVAGVRQYTQLIALMENWDKMQTNLNTANTSSGALNAQAEIYAESWEAARDRVKAAAESLYTNLISDEFFIDLLNNIEKIIGFVDKLVDKLGGMKGLLTTIGAIVTRVMHDSLAQGLTNMAYSMQTWTKAGRDKIKSERQTFIEDSIKTLPGSTDFASHTEKAQSASLKSQLELQQQYLANVDKMSLEEQERNKILMEGTRQLQDQAVEAARLREQAEARVSDAASELRASSLSAMRNDREHYATPADADRTYNDVVGGAINRMQHNSDVFSGVGAAMQGAITAKKNVLINPANAENAQILTDNLTRLSAELGKLDQAALDAAGMNDEFFAKLDDGTIDVDELDAALERLKQELDLRMETDANAIKEVVPSSARGKVDELTASIRNKTDATMRSTQADADANRMHDTTMRKIEQSKGAQKSWADTLVSASSAVMSFSSALSMMSGIWETLKDPDLSGWEKFGKVISSLAMMFPMLVMAFKSLSEVKVKDTIINLLNLASEKLLARAKRDTANASDKAEKEQKEETGAQVADMAVDAADSAMDSTGKGGKFSSGKTKMFSKGGGKFAKGGGKFSSGKTKLFSKGGGKFAAKGGGKALTSGGASLAGSLAIAAVGIAIIAGTAAWAVHQANAAERALEKANEVAKELENTYNTVKAAHDEFMNKASNYDNAVDAIKDLTKGTEEYQNAVKEANNAAMELLATNDNLKYTIEDGQIVIDEASLAEAKAAETEKLENANAAKIAGQNAARLAEENLEKRDKARELKSKSDIAMKGANAAGAGILGGIGAGLVTGAAAGAIGGAGVFSVPAAIIGGVVGAIAGGVIGAVSSTSTEEENEALEKLEKAYLKDETVLQKLKDGTLTDADWDKIGIEDDALRKSLQQNADSVSELVKEMGANTAAIQAQNDAIAATTLADNKAVQNSEFQDQIVDITGDAYGALYDKAMESDWVDSWGKDGIAQIDGANKEAKKVFEEYLKYAGLEDAGYTLTDTTGNDKNRKFVYKDKDGNEQTVSLETMQAARAAYEANSQLDGIANKLVAKFSQLEYSGKKEDQALLSFLSEKNFENATRSEIEAMQAQVGDDGVASADELKKILGTDDLEAAATQYGYKSAQELIDAFNSSLADADTALGEVDIPGMSESLSKNMTIATAKKMQDIISNINAGPLGEKAGQEFMDGLDTMLSGLSDKDKEKALSQLANIDWSAYDAGAQARQIVEDLGGSINMTDEEFQQWVHHMNLANVAVPNADQVIADMNKIKDLTEKTNLGDIISAEDYDLLVKYNAELAKYFTLLADGSAMMTGDALDFKQEMKETQQTYLANAIEASANSAADLQKKYDAGKRALGISEEGAADQWGVSMANSAGEGYYYGDYVDRQLAFLESQGATDSDAYKTGKSDHNDNDTMYVTSLDNLGSATSDAIQSWKQLDDQAQQALGEMQAYMTQYAMTAETAAERTQMLNDGLINQQAYAAAAQAAINTEAWDGLNVEEVGEYASYLEEAFGLAEEQAEEVARATMKMDKGIEALTENWSEWNDILRNSTKGSQEYSKAINGIKKALSDALDVSEDFITTQFIEDADNLKLIEQAANGSTEALDKLGIALAEDIAKQAIKANGIANMDGAISQVETAMDRINELLSQELPDLEVGQIVDEAALLEQMNRVVQAAQMTTEQANAYYRSMGFVPEFETVPMTAASIVPLTTTYHKRNVTQWENGQPIEWTDTEYSTTTQAPAGENIVNAMSMAVQTPDGQGKAPEVPTNKVKSLTYTGGGSMSNHSSANAGGKSGGGGGSKKEKKKLSDELDRYHEVKESLSDITRKMDALSRARDRAFGQKKIDLFNQALAEGANKLAEQERYLQEINDNYLTDRNALTQYGAAFDAEGRLTNYDEMYANSVATYNQAVDDFNAGRLTEDEFKAYEDAYEQFKEDISQYEETLNLLEDEQQEFINLQNEMADLALEKIQYQVEYKIEIEDAELKYLDYQFSHLDDTVEDMAKKFAIFNQQVDANLNKIAAYEEGIKEVFGDILTEEQMAALLGGDMSVLDGIDMTANQKEALAQWRDALLEANNTLYQLRDTLKTEILETFANMNEELDESAAKVEHLSSVLSTYKDILDLIGHKNTNVTDEIMNNINEGLMQASENALRIAKSTYDMNKQALADAQAERAKAEAEGRTEDVEMWDEIIKELETKTQESEQAMLDQWKSAVEEAGNIFEETVTRAIATAEKALSGMYDNLEQMKTAFDQHNEIQDRYLDDYAKIYELNKLIRDINKSIDETDNVKAKRELRDLEQDIAAIYESEEEVSKYQVDHMRAQYELRLAQIALEEAQNAKSQVRMRKDSEGNYSYVFTADEEKVDEAVQNYEDKLYAMQELIQNYIREMEEGAITAQQDMMNAIQELRASDFESEEAYQAEVTRIIEYYTGMRGYYMDELDKALGDSKKVYEQDWSAYNKYTGYKISREGEWVADFSQTTLSITTGFTTMQDAHVAFNTATAGLLDAVSQAYSTWSTKVTGYTTIVGDAVGTLGQKTSEMATTVQTKTDEAATSAETAKDRITTAFSTILTNTTTWQQNYSAQIQAAIDKNTAFVESINAAIAAAGKTPTDYTPPTTDKSGDGDGTGAKPGDTTNGGNNSGGNGNNGGNTGNGNTPTIAGPTNLDPYYYSVKEKKVTGRSYAYAAIPHTTVSSSKWGIVGGYLVEKTTNTNQSRAVLIADYVKAAGLTQEAIFKSFKLYNMMGFDTGGYTGAWGSEGRLAMLHQKELVLNARDTENMLNAVNIIRDISRVIDLNAASSANAFNLISSTYATNGGQTIEQEVTIHAEFPNATDHTEIEEAFNTLINQAAQFANRKN